MAPYFLRNLIPRREKAEHEMTLWQALMTITPIQWALFWSG
jgi:MFS transporter, SHS family, lactate transporter